MKMLCRITDERPVRRATVRQKVTGSYDRECFTLACKADNNQKITQEDKYRLVKIFLEDKGAGATPWIEDVFTMVDDATLSAEFIGALEDPAELGIRLRNRLVSNCWPTIARDVKGWQESRV